MGGVRDGVEVVLNTHVLHACSLVLLLMQDAQSYLIIEGDW